MAKGEENVRRKTLDVRRKVNSNRQNLDLGLGLFLTI